MSQERCWRTTADIGGHRPVFFFARAMGRHEGATTADIGGHSPDQHFRRTSADIRAPSRNPADNGGQMADMRRSSFSALRALSQRAREEARARCVASVATCSIFAKDEKQASQKALESAMLQARPGRHQLYQSAQRCVPFHPLGAPAKRNRARSAEAGRSCGGTSLLCAIAVVAQKLASFPTRSRSSR